jgi:putative hydrolase of the HAD superfamily
MKRFVVWDFDGTLAERSGMWSGTLVALAAEAGFETTREVIRPFLVEGYPWHRPEVVRPAGEPAEAWWGRLEPGFVRAFVEGAGMPAERARELARRVRGMYTDLRYWRVFGDVVPCLRELAAGGWEQVILSNHVPELEQLVQGLGIGGHFRGIYSSAVTGIEKPNVEAFRRVQKDAGEGAELVMVGDNWEADICGAAAAGMRGILVRKEHAEAKEYCADLEGVAERVRAGGGRT